MQCIKLYSRGIINRRGGEVADLRAERIHARDDPELRQQREGQHQTEQYMAHGEHARRSVEKPAVQHGAREKNDARDDGDPVQLAERPSNDVAGQMRVRQNMKGCRREYEGEKDDPTDPDDQREHHEIAQEGHGGRIIASPSTWTARLSYQHVPRAPFATTFSRLRKGSESLLSTKTSPKCASTQE